MPNCSYEVKTINYSELKKIVKLPKFQRSVVWSVVLQPLKIVQN